MASNFDENRVKQILDVLQSNPDPIQEHDKAVAANQSFDENRVKEAMNVLRGTSYRSTESKESKFKWPRFLGERFTKGALNIPDMLQTQTDSSPIHGAEKEYKSLEASKNPTHVSSLVKDISKSAGLDLDSQGQGNTPLQRIVGKGAEFAGSSLIPGGGFSGVATNVGVGATIGAGAGILEESGIPEPIAGLASLVGVLKGAPAIAKSIKSALSGAPGLSDAEKKVANYIQQVLGEEGVSAINENISKSPNYSSTGYEPTTAELANSPFISTLHRLRQGIPGTGLQERSAAQNSAIHNVSDKLSLDASKSSHIKETLGEELSTRKANRHNETHPLYEQLKKDTSQVEPSNIKKFFKENKIVKGQKRKDLEMIKKLIEPSEKLTAEQLIELKNYEKQVEYIKNSKMPDSSKERELSRILKPKSNNPTVADLDEARQNINDKMRRLKKRGEDNRWQQLKRAKEALDKDLAPFALQKEVTEKYAKLSEPVNEILQHPTLKNIPASRLNNIFDGLFNNRSTDNFKGLKQVLKDRPKDWKGIQDSTVEYMMKSIKNAGAEGNRNILSYNKLDKFLEKHSSALEEVFTPDQMKFLSELKSALKGRNIAETAGLEKQSATYGKLMTGTGLTEGLGSKLLKGATYIPHAIPKVGKHGGEALRTMLGTYFRRRESDVMQVLDNFLKNPEYAPKLLNHQFKTQAEFNKQMDMFLKQTASTIPNLDE